MRCSNGGRSFFDASAAPWPGGSLLVDTTKYPYSAIVRITVQIGGVGYQASGVLISPDEVLTASHVVWSTGVGTATDIVVTPGYASGAAPFGTYAGVLAHYNAINDANDMISQSDIPRDYALIHLASATSAGTMALGADFSSGSLTLSGYPGGIGGAQADQSATFSTTTYNVLTGPSLGAGSSGGPLWTGDSSGATVVGLVSAGSNGQGYDVKITDAVRSQLLTWVAQDDGFPAVVGYVDGKTGQQGSAPLNVATGGPSYLQWQYIWSGSDGVALSSSAPNIFLHGGAGQDSIQVASGQNVLDGGAGSNFLTGGSGTDTFFTDARGTAVVWNTLRNFHAGDAATLWGFNAAVSSYRWEVGVAGADGSTGATLRANIVGGTGRNGDGIDASITFAGLSVQQGKALQISTGTQAAGPYLFIYNAGV